MLEEFGREAHRNQEAPIGTEPIALIRGMWLGGAVALAAFLRLYDLGSIPGFGYDEGTIAQLAREIIGGERFAVGIKPYFGPLLIYLIAGSYKLFGISILTTRLPVALLCSLTPIPVYFLAREVTRNWKAAAAAAYLVAASPWQIFFGRFAWDGNISPLFLTTCYFLLVAAARAEITPRRRTLLASLAFLSLGLTLNGHPYLLLPAAAATAAVVIASGRRGGHILAAAPVAALPLLPPLWYQVSTGFRIFDRFLGGYSHHFALAAPSLQRADLLERFGGYYWSLIASLNGTLLYPDLYRTAMGTGMILPPLLFAAGLGVAIIRSKRSTGLSALVAATLTALTALPLIVKTQFFEKAGHAGTFPHYLDGVYPLPYIFIAMVLFGDRARSIRLKAAAAAAAGLVALSLLHVKTSFFDYYHLSWGNGHFVGGLDRVIARVDALHVGDVPVQAMTHFTVSSSLYPQLETVTSWRVEPVEEVLFEPHPLRIKDRIERGPSIFISRGRDAHYQPVLAPTDVVSSPDGSQKWNIYLYQSPVIYVNGTDRGGTALALFAHLDQRGAAVATGVLSTKRWLFTLKGKRLTPVGRFRSGKTVRITGVADGWRPFTLTLTVPGEDRRLSFRLDDGKELFESFDGTICIY